MPRPPIGLPFTFRPPVSGGLNRRRIAILAFLLAMFIPTARMRINWEEPRIDDIVVTVCLMFAESVVLYYAILAITVVRPAMTPSPPAAIVG